MVSMDSVPLFFLGLLSQNRYWVVKSCMNGRASVHTRGWGATFEGFLFPKQPSQVAVKHCGSFRELGMHLGELLQRTGTTKRALLAHGKGK